MKSAEQIVKEVAGEQKNELDRKLVLSELNCKDVLKEMNEFLNDGKHYMMQGIEPPIDKEYVIESDAYNVLIDIQNGDPATSESISNSFHKFWSWDKRDLKVI